MDPAECDRFMVALHYTHGSTLLEKQDTVVSTLSIAHVQGVCVCERESVCVCVCERERVTYTWCEVH